MIDEQEKQNPIQFTQKAYAADLSDSSNYMRVYVNRNRIWDMRCIGMPWDEIAEYLHMKTPTLRKHIKQVESPSEISKLFRRDLRFRMMLYFLDEAELDWYTQAFYDFQKQRMQTRTNNNAGCDDGKH